METLENEQIVNELVENGETSSEKAKTPAQELLTEKRMRTHELGDRIPNGVQNAVSRSSIVSNDHVAHPEDGIAGLEDTATELVEKGGSDHE